MGVLIKELLSFIYWIIIILLASKIYPSNLEYNRKFVHIMIANWWFIAVSFFDSFATAIVVPFIFIFINGYATYGTTKSLVSGLKRDPKDTSIGLIMYPVGYIAALFLGFYLCNSIYYGGIGIMTLGYGDGFAALIGKKFDYKPYYIRGSKKTLSGSIAMFAASYFSVLIYCNIYQLHSPIQLAFVAALSGTITEALSIKGSDNLTIPSIVILSTLLV